jgi:hypothetical protein
MKLRVNTGKNAQFYIECSFRNDHKRLESLCQQKSKIGYGAASG